MEELKRGRVLHQENLNLLCGTPRRSLDQRKSLDINLSQEQDLVCTKIGMRVIYAGDPKNMETLKSKWTSWLLT